VAKGNEKGRVENGVGYVKMNFLAGAELPKFAALNPAARIWLDTLNGKRIFSPKVCQQRDITDFLQLNCCIYGLFWLCRYLCS